MEVNRLCCKQLPGVAILGTGGGEAIPREYFAHAHQFVGLLKGNTDRRSSSKAFHYFLDSETGSKLRENDGGDLLRAMHEGPLGKMMYSYRLRRGSPSSFVTVAGMREIMDGLPNANITMKNKLQEIFAEYLNQSSGSTPLSFEQATPEQCAKDDADEEIEEIVNDTTMVVTQKMWYEVRFSSFESVAEKRVLEAQLQAKDYMIVANESVKAAEVAKERAEKAAEVAKERAEKELAQKELVSVKESAAEDIQIAKLQMQLELAAEKAKLRAEFESDRPERGEKRDKVPRVSQLKMHQRDTMFAKLVSSFWSNDDVNVNSFSKMNISDTVYPWEPITLMPQLTVRSAVGAEEKIHFRSFGFCFRGPAVSRQMLEKWDFIKEAYGVEEAGVHYVCVVFFKGHGRLLSSASTLPYAFGLMPCTIVADLIPGRDYHISRYKAGVSTNDPVLEMLKRPSMNKWFWHSSARKDV